jgi:CheY-like chemotaxis protein
MNKPVAFIIEDDRDIVALFRHVLDVAGYQTEIMLDGKEAMDRLEAYQPSIVLLDLQLPGMSGVDILTHMRADDRMRNIPVIVITAYPVYAASLPVEPDLLLQKPVDINQLGNLVQRLQVTQGGLNEPVHDVVTGLYTFSFFTVRLMFSLERIKQSEFHRFGVLFADVSQVNLFGRKMHTDDLGGFLRNLANHFKLALRPTDTMAWSSRDECFLSLIEDIPSPEIPLKIAGRVRDSMKKFLESEDQTSNLRPHLGVLLCDAEYADVQQIIRDVDAARSYLRDGLYTNPSVFDREMLRRK